MKNQATQLKGRINLNVTQEQKELMQSYANEKGLNLTEYIIERCLNVEDPIPYDHEKDLIQLELKHTKELLQRTNDALNELKAQYNVTFNAMLWHSLPFWKKIAKRLELPNSPK